MQFAQLCRIGYGEGMNRIGLLLLLLLARPALAQDMPTPLMREAEVVFLGEVHDNPHHHRKQAALVAALRPAALVFEMLTPAQAESYTHGLEDAALAERLGWEESGWPDFALYAPVFAAIPNTAQVLGAAVPRDTLFSVVKAGEAGPFAQEYPGLGLSGPLPEEQQRERESLQLKAHCNALPEEMLPGMVAAQRVRDAALAHAVKTALTNNPNGVVVVITGNGHARKDWGAPALLATAKPELRLFSLGQSESSTDENGENGNNTSKVAISGTFDAIIASPAQQRPDACAQFRKK